MKRRTFLQMLAGGAATVSLRPLFAASGKASSDDFFLFVHASGGWDVTLWSDPRNERKGLIEPASNLNSDPGGIKHWKPVRGDDMTTFEVLEVGKLRLGPAIGDLVDLHDRLTIINGIAMNTVSHDDGTAYSITGRHRSGGIIPEPSIDVSVTNELGLGQLMPDVSIRFPTNFAGARVDRRANPFRVATVDAITRSFSRSDYYLSASDRTAISTMLTEEAHDLAKGATSPAALEALADEHTAMPRLLDSKFTDAFTPKTLQTAYPQLDYRARTQGAAAVSAAFAIEAFRRNVVRCVGISMGALDTHTTNYRQHVHTLQEQFDLLAAVVKVLDTLPHPTLHGVKLSERTHILVLSEFCRAPQINLGGGRDHYPNNSALVISPKFHGGRCFGATDPEQLLPSELRAFSDDKRPFSPPDVLATFLGAFGIDPRTYMRDGEIVRDLLA